MNWLELNHFNFLHVLVLVIVASMVFGWFYDKSKHLAEDKFNRQLRAELEDRKRTFEAHVADESSKLELRERFLSETRKQFAKSLIAGRKWLAIFLAEADHAQDDAIAHRLTHKKHPALKAADEVAKARAERRIYKERAKFLEYQLRSYKEYFPFLEEYEDVILDEAIPLAEGSDNVEALEQSDPVLQYVAKAEYDSLPTASRNQMALDRYLSANLSPSAIGRFYERYLGYLWEKDGWSVEYHGIIKGYEDLGRDLICSKGGMTTIIQAKCWSSHKTIHEKHVFQLFGTLQLYLMECVGTDRSTPKTSALFVTSTMLSPVAKKAAEWLNIEVSEQFPLSKSFPMIKCNINQRTKEKIYHLPFDQQYDRTKIISELGECYAQTAVEAEQKGFRRAFRFHGVTA